MNKALLRIVSLVLMLTSGLAFSLAFSPSTASQTHNQHAAGAANASLSALALATPSPAATTPELQTPTSPPEPISHPGSTDGIVIMSIAIVAIILLPLLLQPSFWKK